MKIAIICLSACFAMACGNASNPGAQAVNNAPVMIKAEKPQTAIAHGPREPTPPPAAAEGGTSKWTQSGDPIDTKEFDTAIAAADKALASKPSDEAKKAAATAYFNRAVALTDARQYASALGDYRRTLKHDPTNEEAAEWIERIVSIYASINRGSPKEGEEPPPLPFKKQ